MPETVLTLAQAVQDTNQRSPYELSDFWQKVLLALVAGVVGYVANYFLDRRKASREPQKRLAYDIEVRSGISAIPEDLRERVQVLYGGQVVTASLYDVSCVLRNTGNRVIKHQFVRFRFAEGTKILDVLADDTPEVGLTDVPSESTLVQRRYSFEHLESEQTTHVRFIVASNTQPRLDLHPLNPEGDVKFVQGSVARVAEDVEHLRILTVLLFAYWFLSTAADVLYPFGGAVGLVFFALAAPHLKPAGRVVSKVVQRYLADANARPGISVDGGIYISDPAGGTTVHMQSGDSSMSFRSSAPEASDGAASEADAKPPTATDKTHSSA